MHSRNIKISLVCTDKTAQTCNYIFFLNFLLHTHTAVALLCVIFGTIKLIFGHEKGCERLRKKNVCMHKHTWPWSQIFLKFELYACNCFLGSCM